MRTPKPVNKTVVCSECGLPWDAHLQRAGNRMPNPLPKTVAETVTLADCVSLLKAELRSRPSNPFGSGRVGAGVVNPMYPVTG